ncbi:brain-specific homeobox protein isoform X2 [Drosophila persimilis]|uniref:brain-specific homeobox protein isoform X2 n=1 Tax=Drosophila persimilis TaxID=7234 RepID=UPI000F094B3A|nr:brain-specific homeobox protein isoform X2 [Drosophila persimilis]
MSMLNENGLRSSPVDAHGNNKGGNATTMLTTKTPFSIEHILFQNLNSANSNNSNNNVNNNSNNNNTPKCGKNAGKSASRSSFATSYDNNTQKQHHHPTAAAPHATHQTSASTASSSATASTRGGQGAASGYGNEDYAKSLHNSQRGSHHSRAGASHYGSSSGEPASQQLGSAGGQHSGPAPLPPAPQPPPPPPPNGGGPNGGVLYPSAAYTDHGFLQMTLGYLSPSSGTYKSVDPYFLSQACLGERPSLGRPAVCQSWPWASGWV